MNHQALTAAFQERESDYASALDRVREHLTDEDYWLLREAIELVRCARRMLPGRTLQEIHAAFGAPGDFGYETPIGDALARTYRCEP